MFLIRQQFVHAVVAFVACVSTAYAAPFYDLGSIPAPVKPLELIYSSANHALVIRGESSIVNVDLNTQQSTSRSPVNLFTNINRAPSGRYVYAADYGGENIGYGTPKNVSYVHRLDLKTGVWESKSAYIAGQVQAVTDEQFILKSQDQWVTFTNNFWGSGTAASVLNKPSSGSSGFYSAVYAGDFRYDYRSGRLVHGNSGLSSRELQAFKLTDNDFQALEGSGAYGTANPYGGTWVLSTDGGAFYYGMLKVATSNVAKPVVTFAEPIYAASTDIAFGAQNYYNAQTGAKIDTLNVASGVYGLDPRTNDFWVYDANKNTLRHFSATAVPQNIPAPALASLALKCPATIKSGQTGSCSAIASYADGAQIPVSGAVWSSEKTGVLAVSSSGQITSSTVYVASDVNISATYTEEGVTKTQVAKVTVTPRVNSVSLRSASSTSVLAQITPDPLDVGTTADVWMGALFQGSFFLRNGNSWLPYAGGDYPVAISKQVLSASTPISVVDQIDIASLVGLEVYVGYGTSVQDMVNAPGKLAKIYTVPAPSLVSIALQPNSLAIGGKAQIVGSPALASLGVCTSSNPTVASVSGNVVTALAAGSATINCNNRVATLTVQPPALTGISLQSTTLAAGGTAAIYPQPAGASLGVCTSSNTGIAYVSGSNVYAVASGSATVTCGGFSAMLTVSAPSCQQTNTGSYYGNVTGGYSGTVNMTLSSAGGSTINITGSANIGGLGTISIAGQTVPPQLNIYGVCLDSNGSTFTCLSASGSIGNGRIAGSYQTADGQAGSFSLTKSCP